MRFDRHALAYLGAKLVLVAGVVADHPELLHRGTSAVTLAALVVLSVGQAATGKAVTAAQS